MKLIKEEENKKIYIAEDKVCSMINMGSYVGHKSRKWHESAPEMWSLMFYGEKRINGEDLNIEALIDDCGNYTRFLVEIGTQTRTVQMHDGRVFSDIITDYSTNGEVFTALDGDIYSSSILLNDYLFSNPIFYSGDQLYEGELSNNILIVNFVNTNNELKESIANSKKKIIKK